MNGISASYTAWKRHPARPRRAAVPCSPAPTRWSS